MRIAVCLSGQARTWKYCYQNWFDSLSHYGNNVDFFVHLWNYNSMPMQVWSSNVTGKHMSFEDVLLSDDEMSKIVSVLKPKKYKFQPRAERPSNLFQVENKISWWTVDQFDSLRQCAHLKREYEIENNFQYDLVIRIRSDLHFMKPLNFTTQPLPNTVYVSHPCWDKEYDTFRVSDIVFAADSVTYDQVCSFYDHMAFIEASDVTRNKQVIVYPPEVALYYYYKSVGLNVIGSWQQAKVMRSADYVELKGRVDGYEVTKDSVLSMGTVKQ